MYPGVDYGKLAQQAGGATGQYAQGIDPNWTALAQAYGFIQNPFPAAGTEGQDQMRFMALLKDIMDAQLGGAGGRYAQMSPGNPIAAAPFGLRQYLSGMGPLYNSDQGRALMPMNQADFFGGGFQFGPINTAQENSLMHVLRGQRQGGAVGQEPGQISTPPGSGALPAASSNPALPAGSNSGETPTAAAQVNGGADTTNNPPTTASNTVQETATTGGAIQDIKNALQQADAEKLNAGAESGLSKNAPPPALVRAWNAYVDSRTRAASTAKSKELDFWNNPVFNDFANWVSGSTGGKKA